MCTGTCKVVVALKNWFTCKEKSWLTYKRVQLLNELVSKRKWGGDDMYGERERDVKQMPPDNVQYFGTVTDSVRCCFLTAWILPPPQYSMFLKRYGLFSIHNLNDHTLPEFTEAVITSDDLPCHIVIITGKVIPLGCVIVLHS